MQSDLQAKQPVLRSVHRELGLESTVEQVDTRHAISLQVMYTVLS